MPHCYLEVEFGITNWDAASDPREKNAQEKDDPEGGDRNLNEGEEKSTMDCKHVDESTKPFGQCVVGEDQTNRSGNVVLDRLVHVLRERMNERMQYVATLRD